MGLFDFFKDKDQVPVFKDLIWMSNEAKLKGFLKLQHLYPEALYVAWFEDTLREYQRISEKQLSLKLAHHILADVVKDKIVVFLEHYPLRKKEENLVRYWRAKELIVLSSLQEPLFERFGGSRIVPMLEQLGAKEEELLTHPLINKSIENAQRKLDKRIIVEQLANSMEAWFAKNMKAPL